MLSPATRRSVLLLSFATFSSMAVQRICDAMLPELSRQFGVSLEEAARVISLFAVTYGVSLFFHGPIGDRIGKFRMVTIMTLACSAGCVFSALAFGLDMLLVARMCTGLFAAAIVPLSMAWVGDNVPYQQRQETLARLALGTTLGITCGQLAGGIFTDTLGWRWAFVFMMLLFSSVGLLLLRELRQRDDKPAAPVAQDSGAPQVGSARQAWRIMTGPWSRVVLVIALIEGAAGFGVLAIWATHLHESLELSLSAAGLVVALFGLGGMGYMAAAKHLIPRLGEPGLAAAGVTLSCASALGIAYAASFVPSVWFVAPACLLAGFGFFMFHNTMQTNATQMFPAARGASVSLFACFLFIGQSIGVVLAAFFAERIGSAATVAGGGFVLLASGWSFAVLRRRHEPAQH